MDSIERERVIEYLTEGNNKYDLAVMVLDLMKPDDVEKLRHDVRLQQAHLEEKGLVQ